MTEQTTPDKGRTVPGQGLRHAALAPDGHGQPSLEAVRLSGQADSSLASKGWLLEAFKNPSLLTFIETRVHGVETHLIEDISPVCRLRILDISRSERSGGSVDIGIDVAVSRRRHRYLAFHAPLECPPPVWHVKNEGRWAISGYTYLQRLADEAFHNAGSTPTHQQSGGQRHDRDYSHPSDLPKSTLEVTRIFIGRQRVPLVPRPAAGNMDPVFSLAADFFTAVSEGLRHER